jgi:hypothetical protein
MQPSKFDPRTFQAGFQQQFTNHLTTRPLNLSSTSLWLKGIRYRVLKLSQISTVKLRIEN